MRYPTKPTISAEIATDIIDRATQSALAKGVSIAVAVVDDGGHLLAFKRMDGVAPGATQIVIGKARTAAMFGMPTSALEQLCETKPGFLSSGATTVQGGIPLMHDAKIIGGIGIGGASPDIDEKIAAEALPSE